MKKSFVITKISYQTGKCPTYVPVGIYTDFKSALAFARKKKDTNPSAEWSIDQVPVDPNPEDIKF